MAEPEKTLTYRRTKVVQALNARAAEAEAALNDAEDAITESQTEVIDAMLASLERFTFDFGFGRLERTDPSDRTPVELQLAIAPATLRPYVTATTERDRARSRLTSLRRSLAFYANAADETVTLSAQGAIDTFGVEG